MFTCRWKPSINIHKLQTPSHKYTSCFFLMLTPANKYSEVWVITACPNIACNATSHSRSHHHAGFVWLTVSFAHRLHLINSSREPPQFSLPPFEGHADVIVLFETLPAQEAIRSSSKAFLASCRLREKRSGSSCIHVLLCFLLWIPELSANYYRC